MKYPCPKCGKPNMARGSKAGSGKVRYVCYNGWGADRVMCYSTVNPLAKVRKASGKAIEPEARPIFTATNLRRTVIVTWAQNATPSHKGFMKGLHRLRKDLRATLLIQAGRYKNATSQWTASQENEQWWYPDLTPFLVNTRTELNRNLAFMADIPSQPTDQFPLNGLEGHTHGESCILGHPKRELVMVATPSQRMAKLMVTTGACTVANYTASKIGKKGEFQHIIGALVVEIVDDKIFHHHNIIARKDGAFCYFEKAYYPDGSVAPAGASKLLSIGDLHPPWADPAVINATFEKGGLVERLNPPNLILHDTFDCYAGTRHHEGRPFIAIAKRLSGMDNMAKEVEFTIDFVIEKSKGRTTYITHANHDDMLRQWIERTDWKKDPLNAPFYLRTASYMADNTVMTDRGAYTPDPFHWYVNKRKQKNIICLKPRDSLRIAGYLLHLHGHEGPNGVRGTIRNLSKLGSKAITGHGHAPGSEHGHERNGTSSFLDLDYTGPIGSWANSHTSVDSMNKPHTHICIDGKFWR